MLKKLQHKVANTNNDLDINPYLFNVDNGFLDLDIYSKRSDKNNFFSKIYWTEFDLKGNVLSGLNFFKRFFRRWRTYNICSKAIGYSLTGSTLESSAYFILFGNGLNGKSVFRSYECFIWSLCFKHSTEFING